MKEYSKGIYVKFKPEEVEILHDRMKESGVQNMSAYIRKMALNGYVIIPEWSDLNRVISLHTRISNNLNRYAKKAIFKMMGMELAVDYVINPVEMYLIFPIVILATTTVSAFLTSIYTRKIKSSDTANIE